jgi:glycosyltransferase involved in cell wall biosynthesis
MRVKPAFLIPVYQAQREFEETMQSVAASSVACVVYVVDDGSEPPLHVPDYGPGVEIRLTRLTRNQGIVTALNTGLTGAIGEGCGYIARIDAGDYIRPDRLERQIDYLEKHPQCMLVGSDAEVFDENGRYLFTIEPPREPAALAKALHERAWLLHPGVMYRASVFSKTGLYSGEFPAAEDYEMFLRIAAKYEVGVVPETLLTYIVRSGSISGRKARVQAVSRLRIQLRYFQWTSWVSYYGVLRTAGTLIVPQHLKAALKLRFLYSRRAAA